MVYLHGRDIPAYADQAKWTVLGLSLLLILLLFFYRWFFEFGSIGAIEFRRAGDNPVAMAAGMPRWGAAVLVLDMLLVAVLWRSIRLVLNTAYGTHPKFFRALTVVAAAFGIASLASPWSGGVGESLLWVFDWRTGDRLTAVMLAHNIIGVVLFLSLVATAAPLTELPYGKKARIDALRWQIRESRALLYLTAGVLVFHLLQLHEMWRLPSELVVPEQQRAAEELGRSLLVGSGMLFSLFMAVVMGPVQLLHARLATSLATGDPVVWLRNNGLDIATVDIAGRVIAVGAPAAISMVINALTPP